MGTCFKNFKGTLYKNFVLQNKEPDFDGGQFSKQKDFWQHFKEYRLSKEYLALSKKNKENSQKAMNPHHLSSRGYTKKIPEFEAELEKMDHLAEEGVQVETTHWESRSVIYCMGRNVHQAEDGSLSSTNPPMSELIQSTS